MRTIKMLAYEAQIRGMDADAPEECWRAVLQDIQRALSPEEAREVLIEFVDELLKRRRFDENHDS